METELFYLSSLDSRIFEPVRSCRFIRPIAFETEKIGVVVELEPGVLGQDFGPGENITTFVLTTRFEGASIAPIVEFPCFVFICLPNPGWDFDSETATPNDFKIVGWGELYRSPSDARKHHFD